MSFNNKTLIHEVSQRPGVPDRQNAIEILTSVLHSLGSFCVETLIKGVGTIIPGFGYVFYVNSFDKKTQKASRELHFAFDEKFTQPLNLKIAIAQQLSTYQGSNMPFTDKHGPMHRLNFMVIGQNAGFDYQDCMEGFQLFMNELQRLVRMGQDGTIDFHFGKFTVKNYSAKFTFDPNFIQILEASNCFKEIKTSQVLTGGKTWRPCDHLKPEQIIYK